MASSSTTRVTVIGAGVIGLTSALVLSRDPKNKVLVLAEFMPGDYDIGYASPWAGANFLPMGEEGSLQARLETETWPILKHLAQDVPEACIQVLDTVMYTRDEDKETASNPHVRPGEDPWWKDVVDNYHTIPAASLPSGIAAGVKFTSVCISTALYLPYLVGQCRRQGVVFQRRKLGHIAEAASVPHPDGHMPQVLVNATGLGSRWIQGVEDQDMVPARGQTMLVRNEPGVMMGVSMGKNGEGFGYCMTRAAGGGTILGGCYEINKFDSNPDPNLAQRIMKNCVEFCPQLVGPGEGVEGLKVVRHAVGLRPVRLSGVRIEKETLKDVPVPVVHCYGHGGWGYQTSWASANMVTRLVQEAIARPKAKL
ncbi:D-amino-acid oxidase [Xylariales sp. PMI_506]|nr:D-amino-acid oxidase [Xylariales sp. PMI_506]